VRIAEGRAPPAEIVRADEVLDPDALTIGFARRRHLHAAR
jgi:hypothetical protein